MSSISNVTIEEFINEEDDDFKKDFIGVFFFLIISPIF